MVGLASSNAFFTCSKAFASAPRSANSAASISRYNEGSAPNLPRLSSTAFFSLSS